MGKIYVTYVVHFFYHNRHIGHIEGKYRNPIVPALVQNAICFSVSMHHT